MPKQVLAAVLGLALGTTGVFAQNASSGSPYGEWSGFFVGGGVNYSRTGMSFPHGSHGLTVDRASTAGIDFTDAIPLDNELNKVGSHILGGYRFQTNRFVFGIEADREFGTRQQLPNVPGTLNGPSGAFSADSFLQAGVATYGGFESYGHLRGTAGLVITPTLMGFVSAGAALGRSMAGGVNAAGGLGVFNNSAIMGSTTAGYGAKTMLGLSLGGGVEVKLTDNITARLEYIHDRYSRSIPDGSAAFAATIGDISLNAFNNSGDRLRYNVDTVRGSLSYRFGPPDPGFAVRQHAPKARPAALGNWGGFYVGGGGTYTRSKTTLPDGYYQYTIDDTTTPGIDISQTTIPTNFADDQAKHLLAGFMLPISRFIVGFELDHEFNNKTSNAAVPIVPVNGPNQMNFLSPGGASHCGQGGGSDDYCVGSTFTSSFKTTGHYRFIGGFEINPSLMIFGAAGWAEGLGYMGAVTTTGMVASPGLPPIAGRASVSRFEKPRKITGRTFGGGVQFKATEHVLLRVEYLRDTFERDIFSDGAGFGGTIGDTTVNTFVSAGKKMKFVNDSWRAAVIYQF